MKAFRIFVGAAIPLILLWGCCYLYRNGSPVPCGFYEWTGLYCAGCGSGRAATYFLRGELRKSFFCNMLLYAEGIPCGCIAVYEYVRFVFPGLKLRAVTIPTKLGWAMLWLLVAFWILRNIPLFAILAPQY